MPRYLNTSPGNRRSHTIIGDIYIYPMAFGALMYISLNIKKKQACSFPLNVPRQSLELRKAYFEKCITVHDQTFWKDFTATVPFL